MAINHAERVQQEAEKNSESCGAQFFDGLLEQAAGAQEVEAAFCKAADGLMALGAQGEDEINALVIDYGTAVRDNAFSAGFELGFQQGALLARYNEKAG